MWSTSPKTASVEKITRLQFKGVEDEEGREAGGHFSTRLGVRTEYKKGDKLLYTYKQAEGFREERALGNLQ